MTMSKIQVLKQLPWEEEALEEEFAESFRQKSVNQCKVFQHDDEVNILWELRSNEAPQPSFVCLRAKGVHTMDRSAHYIGHAFLSDAESGVALDGFPKDAKITALCRVKRQESDRTWSSGGDTLSGCRISGIKFTLETAERADRTIVLHCWNQCKPIPYCGDPMSPQYMKITKRELNEETLRDIVQGSPSASLTNLPDAFKNGCEVGFLPADFLCSLGHGFFPHDASGVAAYNGGNTHLSYLPDRFKSIKHGLGIGNYSEEGPLFKFRESYARGERDDGCVLTPAPATGPMSFTIGLVASREVDWIKKFRERLTKGTEGIDTAIINGAYRSIDEFLELPDHLMMSRELNACVPDRSRSGPQLLCTVEHFKTVWNESLLAIPRGNSKQELSVRFTTGSRPLFFPVDLDEVVESKFQDHFKSSLKAGCIGGSLGYHLGTGSRGIQVLTLHGSLEDLLSDLKSPDHAKRKQIDCNRKVIQDGNLQSLLSQRSRGSKEVMALRISNPSADAALACAMVLGGEVPYDGRNHAIYPIMRQSVEHLPLPASCAIIIEVLESMKRLGSGHAFQNPYKGSRTTEVCFREIF